MIDEYFATCVKGTAELLAAELVGFGAREIRPRVGGVAFQGELAVAYRACLWSRVANRVLKILARVPAADTDALYAGVGTLDWSAHLAADGTLAIDAVATRSALTHTQFIAQRAKDAIVDQLRDATGRRPDVDTHAPDVRVNVHLDRDVAQLAIDLGGESLHRRGYRAQQGAAPLKENLAAAILLRARWPALAASGAPLFDPMCGSGTLLIEGALIAADIAPGLLRGAIGCHRWRGHDPATWAGLVAEAEARRDAGLARLPPIRGSDLDPRMVAAARENVARAGLAAHIALEVGDALTQRFPAAPRTGLVVCNLPYGERLTSADLHALYRGFGQQLRNAFQGWEAALLIGDSGLGNAFGIRAQRTHTVYNGALECLLLRLTLTAENFNPEMPAGSARVVRAQQRVAKRAAAATDAPVAPADTSPTAVTAAGGALMFANRLAKNLRTLGRWARRAGVECYRLYDADMPEYALAIDLYHADALWVHVQEYAAPASIDADKARMRLDEALAQLPALLDVPPERIVFKRRERQRGSAQYERMATAANFIEVREDGLRFRVNLRDYLDTGLFLDHRVTRARLRERAAGRDMLNLFAYTATASVHAAAGGAPRTTSVDMSATYCDWARLNLAHNGYGLPAHEVLQADCLSWLAREPHRRYGLIFLDPPTFSNSKRMTDTLDIQRDHVALIRQALRWLTTDGLLIFSTNHRRFQLDRDALADLNLRDLSRETLPEDFRRNARIHQCYELTRRT